ARIAPEPPFVFGPAGDGELRVSARVVREADGSAALAWTPATLGSDGRWRVDLVIPAGGTYRIETQLEQEGSDGYSLTRGDIVHHIGVGDLYLVIGQSNAAGRARDRVQDGPQLGVHQYRADGTWGLAAHPLNDGTRAVHTGHFENHNPGHSPALHFAKRVSTAANVPVGLVVAAFGGAPLRWWIDSDGLGPLSLNAVEMLAAAGGRARGVLWYQGEADCFEGTTDDYAVRFGRLVAALRERLGDPGLEFFTAQLARCTVEPEGDLDRHWGRLREQQRRAAHDLPGVHLVPTGDLPLYDFIHLSSAANLVLAERFADAVLDRLYRLDRPWRAPEPVVARQRGDLEVELGFAPVENWINDFGLPSGRCPFDVEDTDGFVTVTGWRVEGASFLLQLDRPPGPSAVVHGMWRMDHGGIVPADCTRLPFLSFYGVPVS
ncbi:MAG: sialate O-acetylesterase, partial [Propionicimonas sp.]|nr:sialate O-acetylesterase [Propionicimonas sp.]